MKPVKIDNEEVRKAINAGNGYIQIDGRKFLLLEVEEISDSAENSTYMVTNPVHHSQARRSHHPHDAGTEGFPDTKTYKAP